MALIKVLPLRLTVLRSFIKIAFNSLSNFATNLLMAGFLLVFMLYSLNIVVVIVLVGFFGS